MCQRKKLPLLYDLGTRTQKQSEEALFFIDMALTNIRHKKIDADDFVVTSIKETINIALDRYPFAEDEEINFSWQPVKFVDFDYYGNPTLTAHILLNLLKNAIFHTHATNAKIFIELKSDEAFNQLIFEDSGCGISAEILPNIFKPFYTKRSFGSGVGLAFCQLVMESYGGKIECESEEGKYTRFTLYFPVAEQNSSDRSPK